DDLLRHPDDKPSIGIILCKGRNEVIVEYALRDTSKPMGVAQYGLSTALPEQLKRELPTHEDLAQEFPAMSIVKLRIEIEQALRDYMSQHGVEPKRPASVVSLLRDLRKRGLAPASTDDFLEALRTMNEAVHGF